jgi:shikimate dehydrogenase
VERPSRTEPRLLAVLGDPVARSLSPVMQTAAIEALGIHARYVALRTTHRAFPMLVRELLADGGACNVTSPYKDDAFALEGDHTPAATRTHAVNTIFGDPDRPTLDNTDVFGIRDAARVLMAGAPVQVVRIFGTGGGARAAAAAAADEWPRALVRVVSRTPARALGFVRWAADAGVRCEVAPPVGLEREDLHISAIPPLERRSAPPQDEPPDPGIEAARPRAFLDLNYCPGETALVRAYRHAGVRAEDGRSVLVGQGAAAFELFFGRPAPIAVMHAAVEDALRP